MQLFSMRERSMRMMIAAACVSVALGASACEKKQSTGNGAGAGTTTTGGTDAGSGNTAPKTDQATGALASMNSFIEAMADARFGDAVAFVDPASELHTKMSATATNLETLRSSGAPNSADAIKVIEVGFSAPYKKAQASVVTEEADRAMLELERAGFPPVKVQMNKSENGEWLVSAGDELFSPAVPGGNKPPAPKPEGGEG